ncbi:MAG: hypothetical protein K8S00_05565 [Bacteroidales bacterium]|nr:hypothetical protein [Bacteroidales bacterium]
MSENIVTAQFAHIKNNYILGMAAIVLFKDSHTIDILRGSVSEFGQYKVNFNQVSEMLRGGGEDSIREFFLVQFRALIKDSFEALKSYCIETNQLRSFKDEPWYHFIRIIRNCLSHNYKFMFSAFDKTILPISWNGITIDISLNKQPMQLSLLNFVKAWELVLEFEDFIGRLN